MADFTLNAPEGANKAPKRVGRGSSSGLGTTAGKGNKGQQSRSGGKTYIGFEGGQMPLYRRIAHRGFSNYPFKKEFVTVNVKLLEEKFNAGDTVNKESLIAKGLLDSADKLVKILADGELTKKLTVEADKVSVAAKEKIEKAGGSVKVAEASEAAAKAEPAKKATETEEK